MPGFLDALVAAFDLSALLGIITSAAIFMLGRALHHQMIGFCIGGFLAFFTLLSASIVFSGTYSFSNFPQPKFVLAILFETPEAIYVFARDLLSGAMLGVPISVALILIGGLFFLNDLAKSIAAERISVIEAEKLQLVKAIDQAKEDADRRIKEIEANAQSTLDEANQLVLKAEGVEAKNRQQIAEYRKDLAFARRENAAIDERVKKTNAKIDKMERQVYSQAIRNKSAVITLDQIIEANEENNPKFVEAVKANLEQNRSIAKKKYDKLKVQKLQIERQYQFKSY